mmetsp:Transcript_32543/g.68030  ORF Transcript_32543/g.68030 Transcript_32543/m.68030 type:complete len:577 (-) Transcript_32543:152-1882(-)
MADGEVPLNSAEVTRTPCPIRLARYLETKRVRSRVWSASKASQKVKLRPCLAEALSRMSRMTAASQCRSKVRQVATPLRACSLKAAVEKTGSKVRRGTIASNSKCYPKLAGLHPQVMRDTDLSLHRKVDSGEAPGVISVVLRHGILAHMDSYGYADLERQVPMRPDTIVRLYSMTKSIISVALGICIEEGLVQLTDPVCKFIPAFAAAKIKSEDGLAQTAAVDRPLTVLHLLTHTSGIGYGPMLGDEPGCEAEERFLPLIERAGLGRTSPGDARAVKSLQHWCEELARIPLLHQPGTEWFYSYSHDVLGRIIEVVTGTRLDIFIEERITQPLGMVDSGFQIPRDKWHRTAAMYRLDEQDGETKPKLVRIDAPSVESNEWMVGNASPILSGGGSVDSMTGGMVSTAADYARFCLMLLGKGELEGRRILKPETVDFLCSNQLPRASGRDETWAFGTPGVGFGPVGSVSVSHPLLDQALRPGEYGWGGMAGTAWTNDPQEDFVLLSFSLVAFDLSTEEVLRAGVRKAISEFQKEAAQRRLCWLRRCRRYQSLIRTRRYGAECVKRRLCSRHEGFRAPHS